MILAAGIVVAAAIAGTSAQGLSSVSATCQSAVTTVLAGPAGMCLGVAQLMAIETTPANRSIIPAVDNWANNICSQPACSSDVLDAAFNNITSGCQLDVGLDSSSKQEIEGWYPTAREVACLKDSNANNAYCITTTLQALEKHIGKPLSINTFSSGIASLGAANGGVPKELTCTDCVQAAYAIIRPKLNSAQRDSWDSDLSAQCGSSFATGTSPSSIKQSANTSPPAGSGSGNGALSLSSGFVGALGAALLGVAGVTVLGL